jgi:SARP family transcriptional regulator, regulator of embCAB operon
VNLPNGTQRFRAAGTPIVGSRRAPTAPRAIPPPPKARGLPAGHAHRCRPTEARGCPLVTTKHTLAAIRYLGGENQLKYQILGPLRLVVDNAVHSISAPKIETLLSVLLIRSNQVVSTSQLIAEVWDERPPRRATAAVHVYISNLRKLLSGNSCESGSPIVTRTPGYLLRLESDELDLVVFQRLVRQGRRYLAENRFDEAVRTFDEALALWRGPIPQASNGPVMTAFFVGAEEARLECVELRVEANLQLGRHRAAVSDLYGLVNEHPLHEVFYGQLMRALYQSRRRADALDVYRQLRELLRRELGLEPGQALRELQRAVLTDTVAAEVEQPARFVRRREELSNDAWILCEPGG